MTLDMETERMLMEGGESWEHWDAWRRVFSRVRREAEILEWCAGSVRDSVRRRRGFECEDFHRFAEALGRLEALLGDGTVSEGIASIAERLPEDYERGRLDGWFAVEECGEEEYGEEEEEWL